MAIGTIFTIRGHCDPAYTLFTFDSADYTGKFNHDLTFASVVYSFQQPYPDPIIYDMDSVSLTFAVENTGSPGLINHITEDFVLEIRYPEGQEQDLSIVSINSIETLMVIKINAAFGLSLTTES